MSEAWVVQFRDRCLKFGVPFFFKQWGGVHKKRAGRLLEGVVWDEMPHQTGGRVGQAKRRNQWPELCKLVESDDGLPVNEFGQWTEQKLHFWNRYIEITTSAMVGHPQWEAGIIYVDLFSGAGICRIEGSGRRIPGSPLIAACAPKPFRHILLCEKDDVLGNACEKRIHRIAPNAAIAFLRGDCNQVVHEIAGRIPNAALTLAFIDPQGMDVEFETIRVLAKRGRVDLLILLADAVDFVRNVDIYRAQTTSKPDRFFGSG